MLLKRYAFDERPIAGVITLLDSTRTCNQATAYS